MRRRKMKTLEDIENKIERIKNCGTSRFCSDRERNAVILALLWVSDKLNVPEDLDVQLEGMEKRIEEAIRTMQEERRNGTLPPYFHESVPFPETRRAKLLRDTMTDQKLKLLKILSD